MSRLINLVVTFGRLCQLDLGGGHVEADWISGHVNCGCVWGDARVCTG